MIKKILSFFSIKNIEKIFFVIFLFLFIVFLLRGGSNKFATILDKANVLYLYDSGITSYGTKEESILHKNSIQIADKVWKWKNYDFNYRNEKNTFLFELFKEAKEQAIILPSNEYWEELDDFVLKMSWRMYKGQILLITNGFFSDDSILSASVEDIKCCLDNYGYLKFFSRDDNDNIFQFIDDFNKKIKNKLGVEKCPNEDFLKLYKQKILSKLQSHSAFVNFKEGLFGNFTTNHLKASLEPKTFNMMYNIGLIEAFFIYPIDFYIEKITDFIGDYTGSKDFGMLLAFFLIVVLMKFFLLEIEEDIKKQKKIVIKPKINKIINKYANVSNENFKKQYIEYEKSLIYKKCGIDNNFINIKNIFNILIFFIFFRSIQSSAIMSESCFNLYLSDSLINVLFNLNNFKYFIKTLSNSNGFLFALILAWFNIITQIISFKLPNYIKSKYNELLNNKLFESDNNLDVTKKNKSSHYNYIIIIMLVFFITLAVPASIIMYLILRSLFSIIQSVIVFRLYKDKIIKRCNFND